MVLIKHVAPRSGRAGHSSPITGVHGIWRSIIRSVHAFPSFQPLDEAATRQRLHCTAAEKEAQMAANPISKAGKQLEGLLLDVPELPVRILETYARLWQFETWLRRLVYVELRAAEGNNWAARFAPAEKFKEADKRLTHMPTREEDLLSFAQLSKLGNVISEEWRLFAPILPPQLIWKAKLEEVSQIRHRVAHFRLGHHDDLQRLIQLLRDVDKGFWKFCTSYNDPRPVIPHSADPVVSHFLDLDLYPWRQLRDNRWARVGTTDPNAPLSVTVEVLCRPWASWSTPIAGTSGLLYDVQMHASPPRSFEYLPLLESTASVHPHIVHICLDSMAKKFRLTIPAVLGSEAIIAIVERFTEAAHYCLQPSLRYGDEREVQALADASPEYILGPAHPLAFLGPQMPCSIFAVL